MRLLFLLSVITFALGIPAVDDGTLAGKVANIADGAGLRNVYILIHRSGSEANEIHAHTDRDGRLNVRLEPGFYDVFVSGGGLSPTCAKVEIVGGKETKYMFKLGVSRV